MTDRTTSVPVPAHEVLIVPATDSEGRAKLLQDCVDVRIAVFVDEQKFPLDVEIDGHDPTATHILLRLVPSLQPIGTIRVYKVEGEDYYKLSRLAVLKEYRHHRFGRVLVLALHEWVKEHAGQTGGLEIGKVVCHSQMPVKAFYAKYGYLPEGDEFDEDGAPHQKMVARLSLSE
ncbi:acyl-CoA N-acyltransferase [Hygrophoropsis aurantiaca]|uniref:Acyl-CoA N-acyltransferase n=1 Tax=Hygrophoropsis aurantiaca TaxID=72124 RepID=A0ACB8AV26_9AGAM|nr:acyl-CoA N-acyltransferase [Hygrophoropsis aurantiaca]